MRGVLILILMTTLLLSGCISQEEETDVWDVSQYNRVLIIDYPYEDLDDRELKSIQETYENENKALALYRKSLDLFKNEEPFGSILVRQEAQIRLLEEVYTKYELILPEENWYPKVATFETPTDACSASLVFAQRSIDLYTDWLDNDNLDDKVNNQDLRFIYEKIKGDYENIFIPQFKRCS